VAGLMATVRRFVPPAVEEGFDSVETVASEPV
jgi:hypothetical protein